VNLRHMLWRERHLTGWHQITSLNEAVAAR
jgi:hypothetical protein